MKEPFEVPRKQAAQPSCRTALSLLSTARRAAALQLQLATCNLQRAAAGYPASLLAQRSTRLSTQTRRQVLHRCCTVLTADRWPLHYCAGTASWTRPQWACRWDSPTALQHTHRRGGAAAGGAGAGQGAVQARRDDQGEMIKVPRCLHDAQ